MSKGFNYCLLCTAAAALGASVLVFQLSNVATPTQSSGAGAVKADFVHGLRHALSERPSDGNLSAALALALLEPVDEVAPNTDEGSLYGGSLTLYHPNLEEARRLAERALHLSPDSPEAHLAHQAVQMSEANGEDALQAGRKAVELRPQSADAYVQLARAYLLAGCAQGCAARNSLRDEKKEEKKRGRKSALVAREEEAQKHAELNANRKSGGGSGSGRSHLEHERSALRAGAMWRIMEAGRTFKQAHEADPTHEYAKELERNSRHLITLNANKVLSTQQVIEYGQCHFFFGQELDGQLCDRKRYKYE
mmetsp:Transcript_7294/g.19116  ORF Transcript_7294/g.19116 Transcript_7294/m.19116 type:complete len:308 (+) Transcript_7294:33-956(+)|eukprot:CAMPEP_0115863234 /NCGR_PEP_ID=MMETSP0287-20121206/18587_1 /TAXON_ID=412157 /ORGANISM="Chrysochromulina rotalis, Strain UIO044" /LENGTH=307 /DNA_ID=CAMNT_0003317681 /DNA_START=10 /DNA_END=933 /DNA_ORIENTATION=-